ncbi:redoxin domain-containing protein [Parendozoicomonas haliclonae]|uniref:Thioredoxin peroxidase n=1 Tax=Parendozoicomonas haliclonae TaxID=1960125 RepID=A0A1X7AIG6_9GAMM|nr:redoxin domain-containing protein [Parendozoicomonas haliclonae]SMA43648.1 Selenocysteine-containing peroxiredoxin PrxU [Parendozoicomonas haliclonae]
MKRFRGYLCALFTSFSLFAASSWALQIGDTAPDFTADTSQGVINFHEWGKGKYVLLFSHPLDFTPVCSTELAAVHNLKNQLDSMNTLAIGLSVDNVDRHTLWQKDILKLANSSGSELNYPLIGDHDLNVSKLYGMLGQDTQPGAERTAKDNKTARTVFLIGPNQQIKMMLVYPMTTGRNFDEILRVLKSIQLTDQHNVATPANWQDGDKVVVSPGMIDEDAKNKFGEIESILLPSADQGQKNYLRYTHQPEG